MSDETKAREEENRRYLEQRAAWFTRARETHTPEQLAEFIAELSGYRHDYSSIVVACAVAAYAAALVIDRSPHGGITGFQAGGVLWEFITAWEQWDRSADFLGARLVRYEDLLYPQNRHRFTALSRKTWNAIVERAKGLLAENDRMVHPDVRAHWQALAQGHVPFGLGLED